MSVFLQAVVILLREGLEALLVLAALAAYVRRVAGPAQLATLYVGAGLALVASLIAAFLFETFNSGMHNDTLEGVTILLAAGLMLYVSGWLFLRQEPQRWQHYLRERADAALSAGTRTAIASLAFLAVFREGAETVLFVHALANTAGGWTTPLIAGLVSATLALVGLFLIINVVAQRLPLRPVFLFTSAFLFLMSVKFLGEAIQEFQEQQIVSYTELEGAGWLSTIGFNPTIEAVAVQGAVVVLAVLTVLVFDRWSRARASGTASAA